LPRAIDLPGLGLHFASRDTRVSTELLSKPALPQKFTHPDITAKGEPRANVPLDALETLWINTGTLCNITCQNCYIESSPSNDRLEYIKTAEVSAYLDEIAEQRLGTHTIGYTGGEPFLNPDMLAILEDTLRRGLKVLLLTNAMQPMQRPKVKTGLLALRAKYGEQLRLRVSLDHFTQALHETERGLETWAKALVGLDWLAEHTFNMAIAGRTCWNETEATERAGYAELIKKHGWLINPNDREQLMLLPEMDSKKDVPEITTACWDILNLSPSNMMCATSRMVVKRKGADKPTVTPCTLLPYEPQFEMGVTLKESMVANTGMFANGAVKLCHVHCAKFCVLGGGSCS
jgi:sulfatase maturation enzyme AslB (radical SAM superfamily)